MPADSERELGLYAVPTISVGATIGSGTFVLPGLAAEIAGPAVALAYLPAGLLALPAARRTAAGGGSPSEVPGQYGMMRNPWGSRNPRTRNSVAATPADASA